MKMTTAQLQAFKAAIAANANTVTFDGITSAISAIFPTFGNTQDGAQAIANWYNLAASPAFLIFNTAVPNATINNGILFANYTPSDPITTTNDVQWTACSMSCQGKQFNLQNMGLNNPFGTFDASLLNYRKGLKDATTNLPSGASFALQDGGWAAGLGTAPGILTRNATTFEALMAVASTGPLAGGTAALGTGGAQGVANVAVPGVGTDGSYIQGSINFQDVFNAWA